MSNKEIYDALGKKTLSVTLRSLLVIIAPIIVYNKEFIYLINEGLNNELTSHILIIPFIIGFMVYWRRNVILKTILYDPQNLFQSKTKIIENVAGSILIAISFLLKIYGSLTFYPVELHLLSLPIFLVGLILILFNYRTLLPLRTPLILLLFLVPPPFQWAQRIGATLSSKSAYAAHLILSHLSMPVKLSTRQGAPIIYLTTKAGEYVPFAIDIACSGLYSLIGFIVFTIFFISLSKGSLRSKAVTSVLGVLIIFVMNVLRITGLIVIGYYMGTSAALNSFHFFGGWVLVFLGTISLIKLAEKYLNISFLYHYTDQCRDHIEIENQYCFNCGVIISISKSQISESDITKVTLLLITALVISFFNLPLFTITQIEAEIIQESSINPRYTSILPDIVGYDLNFIYRDTAFEKLSQQDASLMYTYRNQEELIWVGVEIAESKSLCHPWEACLVTYAGDAAVTQIDLRGIRLLENPPLSARYFAYQDPKTPSITVVLYWYTHSTFRTPDGYAEKYVKISVIDYAENIDEVEDIEARLLPFATKIAEYWEPLADWSAFSLSIAKNGPTLILIGILGLIVSTISSYYITVKKKQLAHKIFKGNLTRFDKMLLAQITNNPIRSLKQTLSSYTESTGDKLGYDDLLKKLENAHAAGLLDKNILIEDNEVFITWNSNLSIFVTKDYI